MRTLEIVIVSIPSLYGRKLCPTWDSFVSAGVGIWLWVWMIPDLVGLTIMQYCQACSFNSSGSQPNFPSLGMSMLIASFGIIFLLRGREEGHSLQFFSSWCSQRETLLALFQFKKSRVTRDTNGQSYKDSRLLGHSHHHSSWIFWRWLMVPNWFLPPSVLFS